MTLPLTEQSKAALRPLPLVYKHTLTTAHDIKNHTTYDSEGWALVFKQVIRLRK